MSTRNRAPLVLPVLLLLAACAAEELNWESLQAEIDRTYPDARTMTIDGLRQRRQADRGLLLIDVRAEEEYAVSRIPGAIHLTDADAIATRAAAHVGPVVLYCSVGYRSGELAAELAERGHTEVYNLKGSIFAWANRGFELEDADGPAETVHPYDDHWGRLLDEEYHPD